MEASLKPIEELFDEECREYYTYFKHQNWDGPRDETISQLQLMAERLKDTPMVMSFMDWPPEFTPTTIYIVSVVVEHLVRDAKRNEAAAINN